MDERTNETGLAEHMPEPAHHAVRGDHEPGEGEPLADAFPRVVPQPAQLPPGSVPRERGRRVYQRHIAPVFLGVADDRRGEAVGQCAVVPVPRQGSVEPGTHQRLPIQDPAGRVARDDDALGAKVREPTPPQFVAGAQPDVGNEAPVRSAMEKDDAGASPATLASVRRRLFAAIGQPSRAAPTVSAASRTMASDRCVYFSVVAGSRCPSRRPMVSTVSPCARAVLAYEWRKS